MNKILAAVDFSECSMNAFRQALNYAKIMEAHLTMVWVDPETLKFINPSSEQEDAMTRANEAFEGIWKQYKNDLPHSELKYMVKRGQVYEEIVKTAVAEDADMIVAGTHGVSGFKEFWMGSNVFRLIMASPIPVLSIRESARPKQSISTIVLPIDSTLETKQKSEVVALLARHFDSDVHLLSLYSSSVKDIQKLVESYTEETRNYLDTENVTCFTAERKGNNITNMTLDYAREVDADLIVIMTEQEIKPTNLWMGTYARQMVNHSEIPVLSIKPKELVSSLRE